jgi:ELWxxDGT repeat protein
VLYFQASDEAQGIELWKSDGTAAGTTLVQDINAGANGSSPANLMNVNGKLYFTANDEIHGTELWVLDTRDPNLASGLIAPAAAT